MRLGKILLMVMLLSFVSSTVYAAPTVKRTKNTFAIEEAVNDDILGTIKAEMGQVDQQYLSFALKKITNDDLAKLCAAYPGIDGLTIENSKDLTSIAPVAGLKGLRGIKLGDTKVADLSPLAGLTEMQVLELSGKELGPDLKWMSGMTKLTNIGISAGKALVSFEGIPQLPKLQRIKLNSAAPADLTPLLALPALTSIDFNSCTINDISPLAKLANLTDLNLYGATISDFGPLSEAPQLKKLTYYATKGSDYSTLGKLTQVENLQGGLTDLADIAWVENLQNLKELRVFAELVEDYTPLAKTKLEKLTIWNMKKPTNLAQLSGATSLKYLKLWGLKDVSGFEGLGSLVNLEEFIIDGLNKEKGSADLSFIKGLTKIKTLNLRGATLTNVDGLASLSVLKKLDATELNAREGDPALDLSFLAKLGALESLDLSKSRVSKFEAVADAKALTSVTLTEASGITSLAALKQLPKLKNLTVSKDAFPAAELSGFAETVKINQR